MKRSAPGDATNPVAYRRGTGVSHPVDVHVGARIRMRRLLLGMKQETLARHLDLTFQQVQKYETGSNRVTAGRLAALASILAVPISYFFADYADEAALSAAEQQARALWQRPEAIDLVRFYYAIPDPRVREQFLEMVKAVAANQ